MVRPSYTFLLQVMESEEFLLLPVNQLIDIISSEELNVQNEEQVYVAAMAWVKHSLEDRKQHLSMVMPASTSLTIFQECNQTPLNKLKFFTPLHLHCV